MYGLFSATVNPPTEVTELFFAKFSWSCYDFLTSLAVLYLSNRLENVGAAAGAQEVN